jgi:hypothetical protein
MGYWAAWFPKIGLKFVKRLRYLYPPDFLLRLHVLEIKTAGASLEGGYFSTEWIF